MDRDVILFCILLLGCLWMLLQTRDVNIAKRDIAHLTYAVLLLEARVFSPDPTPDPGDGPEYHHGCGDVASDKPQRDEHEYR